MPLCGTGCSAHPTQNAGQVSKNKEKGRDEMGAPKGNTNALKHGLYAKHFTLEEQAKLRRMAPDDIRPEIQMMRKAVKNVFDIQVRIHALLDSMPSSNDPKDVEALAKITNSLALAMTALNTTARTQALFSGTDEGLNDPLDEALDGMAIFLDDTYLKEEGEETGEVLVEEVKRNA
jgi:uncharacterized protein YjcR